MVESDAQLFWFTLLAATLAVLLNLGPGVALAWLLARKSWPGKALVETCVVLPLVIPPVATGLILLELLGRRGPIGRWLHQWGVDVVFTWKAVVIAMAVMSFPLLVRGARLAFESVNPRLERVAASLGASPSRIFATITLPLAFRGILAGVVLAFARALGEFGATILVAGNIPGLTTTLSTAIYSDIQLGHDGHAWGLLAISVVLAFGAVAWSEWLLRKRPIHG
ncbi:MAG TPA: molybdate ABC transporter permease subunit [Chthoniobacterales bacterium]|jgi:molybdate transport system permease protein